jgi:hypothetical protein
MSANFIGIAPGMTGALALLSNEGALLEVADMPTLADGTKGRSTVNAPLLASYGSFSRQKRTAKQSLRHDDASRS